MVFLNIQIDSIIEGLDDASYIPESLTAGGATTATVEATSIEPTEHSTGDLWFNTSDNVLKIWTGTLWQSVSLTSEEVTRLASLETAVALAQSAELGAIEARDKILSMTAATGAEGTEVIWNNTTGILTVPIGDTGSTGPTGDTGEQGIQGIQGVTGQGLVVKGTDTAVNIQAIVGASEGDFWIASDTGDGWSYIGATWVNTGQIRGPIGLTGEQGIQGIQGETGLTGNGIATVIRTVGDGSAGTTDTYTITYTDATTSTFDVYNGADGIDGEVTNASLATTLTSYATKANPIFTGLITEQVSVSTLTLGATSSVQTYTATADFTIIDDLADGEFVTFMLTNGGFTPTYPTITWWEGAEPTLGTTDKLFFEKIGATLYGSQVASIA